MYAGELNKAMEKGDIMGHDAIGFVEKVGSQVRSLIAGDKVIILPVIACGKCDYYQQEEYSGIEQPGQKWWRKYMVTSSLVFSITLT